MALTDDNGMNATMLVSPTGLQGNNGFGNFGGDGWWILILFLLLGNNGWGGGFGGGYEFPWLFNGQQNINTNTNNGFRDAMINDGINSVRDGINGLQTQICNSTADVQMALANGFAGVEQGANARQIANMQQAFNVQTAVTSGMNDLAMGLQNCCCENRASIADLKYTIATENCADRAALNEGVRDIIANQTAGIQTILDKLCDQELQAERRENQNLRSELMYARGQASQIEQTAQILAGQNSEVDALYNRLSNCPVPSTPVYSRTPIFTCNQNQGCGCGSF